MAQDQPNGEKSKLIEQATGKVGALRCRAVAT